MIPPALGFPRVAGLQFFDAAVSAHVQSHLASSALGLLSSVETIVSGAHQQQPAHIPQPIRSERHNLAEERFFRRVRVPDNSNTGGGNDGPRILSCEHFSEYGSSNHSLTYFQRNCNVPQFGHKYVIEPLLNDLPAVQRAASEVGKDVMDLEWRMTLNRYRLPPVGRDHDDDDDSSLFPFHVDLAQNGIVTAILTLLEPAEIQFVAGKELLVECGKGCDLPDESSPERVELTTGSLLVASDDARWRFLHRVVESREHRQRRAAGARRGEVSVVEAMRLSLVFGCR